MFQPKREAVLRAADAGEGKAGEEHIDSAGRLCIAGRDLLSLASLSLASFSALQAV